ncbi:hypothetical protein EFQ99_00020 [Rhizobium vallis]|uniref:DNA-directed DNA polymerase family A palm domain-containing protein n=2 Tax=Rhizobium vallis TaxID=634290 RepID=A0A3S0TE18_9HYPH|nr:hypothetical protein EFQ99_00020 [Rhizobium vallis]
MHLKDGTANQAERGKVQHFDPWLVANGTNLVELVDCLFSVLTPPPITPGRRHRADAIARRKACAEALIANLVMAALGPSRSPDLVLPLRKLKRSRYDREDVSPNGLRWATAELAAYGYVEVEAAVYKEERTRLIPTLNFVSLLNRHGVKREDVGRARGDETIVLQAEVDHEKVLVDYRDTPETITLRGEMSAINEALEKADIRFDGEKLGPIHLSRRFDAGNSAAPYSFDQHGRLYGGLWESLPRVERHRLTIGGETVADLDFSSMFVRLAYVRRGVVPPDEDLYAIPGLEHHREGVKRVIASLFFRESESKRLPRDAKPLLPEGWTMARVRNAIAHAHPAIAPLLDTDVGFELMATESNLLVAILLDLFSQGVVALPMHDGLMVPESKKEIAVETMKRVSLSKLGVSLPVTEKQIPQPSQAA